MKNVTQGITVVIVSYYSLDIIQGCLTSISEYTREYKGEVEIIIVDNANDDKFESNILQLIGSLNLTVRLINSSLNLGYGGGNNLGLNAASFDIVCIMNPDVRLIEPLFNDVAGIFQCNEDLCLVGCKQVSKKSRAIHIRPEYSIPLFKPVLSFLCNYFNYFNNNFNFLSGAFFFVDRNKFIEAGGFDENIFMYGEEADITVRIGMKGYNVNYIDDLHYLHLDWDRQPPTIEQLNRQLESIDYYLEKFNFSRIPYYTTYLVHCYIKLISEKFSWRDKASTSNRSYTKSIWKKLLGKSSV